MIFIRQTAPSGQTVEMNLNKKGDQNMISFLLKQVAFSDVLSVRSEDLTQAKLFQMLLYQ